ncbi:MAG: class I SAM-dependent methyltransferase [Magnetococcales bacterium]|nr:class I SAM-dependent methyltransferase [Magnetococcales bacterium]
MPDSFKVFDVLVSELARIMQPTTFLDIGCGYGKYGLILRSEVPTCHRIGIEVEEQYVNQFRLDLLYHEIKIMDASTLVRGDNNENYDLVIIGDCIEHMPKSQGIDLLNFLTYRAGCIIVLAPEFMVQDNLNGVNSEAHLSVWSRADFAWHDAWAYENSSMINLYIMRGYRHPINSFIRLIHTLNQKKIQVMNFDGTQPVRDSQLELVLSHHSPALTGSAMEVLRQETETAMTQGRVEDALRLILQLKKEYSDPNPFTGEFLHNVTEFVVERFNSCIEQNNLKLAESTLLVIMNIFSVNQYILQQAFALYEKMGEVKKALAIREQLIEYCYQHGEIDEAINQRIQLARAINTLESPLYVFYNLYLIVNHFLMGNLDTDKCRLIEEMVALAHQVKSEKIVPDSLEIYYQSAMKGIDIPLLSTPLPIDSVWPDMVFATSTGHILDEAALKAEMARQQTKILFFVAADEIYVQKYGQLYASSVLKNCDTPCLVIIHVIGAAKQLARVASQVGLNNPRLFYSADFFDPTLVTAQCHTTPPFKTHALAAHYQSARFIWLGYLLNRFNLPIFVSDIDLVLQRGVESLLARHTQNDVVLFRHEHHPNFQFYNNKFNAALMLVRPTFIGETMARFFKKYLEIALSKDHIDRFIDQVALTMTHHYICRIPSAQIGFFDELDINTELFVYDSYPENNFIFFRITNFIDSDRSGFTEKFIG